MRSWTPKHYGSEAAGRQHGVGAAAPPLPATDLQGSGSSGVAAEASTHSGTIPGSYGVESVDARPKYSLSALSDGARFHAPGLVIQILQGCHRSAVPMLGEDEARFHAPGLMIQILQGCHWSAVPMLGEDGARFRAPGHASAPLGRHRCATAAAPCL